MVFDFQGRMYSTNTLPKKPRFCLLQSRWRCNTAGKEFLYSIFFVGRWMSLKYALLCLFLFDVHIILIIFDQYIYIYMYTMHWDLSSGMPNRWYWGGHFYKSLKTWWCKASTIHENLPYCWWFRNPAPVDMKNIPFFNRFNRVSYITGGAGFLPSIVWTYLCSSLLL